MSCTNAADCKRFLIKIQLQLKTYLKSSYRKYFKRNNNMSKTKPLQNKTTLKGCSYYGFLQEYYGQYYGQLQEWNFLLWLSAGKLWFVAGIPKNSGPLQELWFSTGSIMVPCWNLFNILVLCRNNGLK